MPDFGPDTGAARRALDKFKKLESQVSKMGTRLLLLGSHLVFPVPQHIICHLKEVLGNAQ